MPLAGGDEYIYAPRRRGGPFMFIHERRLNRRPFAFEYSRAGGGGKFKCFLFKKFSSLSLGEFTKFLGGGGGGGGAGE